MKRLSLTGALVMLPALASAAEAESGGSYFWSFLQMLASLAIVIGLIYLVAWVVARWQRGGIGPGRRQQEIRLVESRFLGPKKSLILVEVAGERLLLATSGQEITLLKELGRSHAPPDEEKDDFQPMAPFSDQFAKVVNTLPTAVARPLNGFAALLARKRNEHAVAELQEESEELLALEDERLNRLKSLAQWRWQR